MFVLSKCTTFLLVTQVCDTYPADLFVPKSVTLPVIIGSSKFRSRGRFPTLSYYCKENHVSLSAHLEHSFCSLSIHLPLLKRLWRISSCLPYVLACQIFCHRIEDASSRFKNTVFLRLECSYIYKYLISDMTLMRCSLILH